MSVGCCLFRFLLVVFVPGEFFSMAHQLFDLVKLFFQEFLGLYLFVGDPVEPGAGLDAGRELGDGLAGQGIEGGDVVAGEVGQGLFDTLLKLFQQVDDLGKIGRAGLPVVRFCQFILYFIEILL